MSWPAFRALHLGDLDSLASLERISFDQPWPRSALSGELRLSSSIGFGLRSPEPSGALCAYALFRRSREEAELARFAVSPSCRRQGLADRLLTRSLEDLRGAGIRTVHLEVRADNLPARSLYQKHGFRVVGRRRAYYRDGADALIMSLRWPPGGPLEPASEAP